MDDKFERFLLLLSIAKALGEMKIKARQPESRSRVFHIVRKYKSDETEPQRIMQVLPLQCAGNPDSN